MKRGRQPLCRTKLCVFDVIETLSEKRQDMLVVQRIVDAAPFLARAHQMQISQNAQLMRRRRLTDVEQLGQIIHAHLPAAQSRDDAHARCIAQRLERLSKSNGGFLVQQANPPPDRDVFLWKTLLETVGKDVST